MSHLRAALVVFAASSVVCGVVYPAVVTGIAQIVFPHLADGSLVTRDGQVVGSELVGQHFDDPRYFWGRPSATSGPYNAAGSSGSNLGPMNPALVEAVSGRMEALAMGEGNKVPVDLVTASASGLDPHVSPAAASVQVARVAAARGLDPSAVRALVDRHVAPPELGFLGDARVNVLALNQALDEMR